MMKQMCMGIDKVNVSSILGPMASATAILPKNHEVKSLSKTQSSLAEESDSTNIEMDLLQDMVVCTGILLNMYPDKFGEFVRGVFDRESPKILQGYKPSGRMQHCLSRNFLSMFRNICKDYFPKVDKVQVLSKTESVVSVNVIKLFTSVFEKECRIFMAKSTVTATDIYEYDDLVLMVKIINTIALSINDDLLKNKEDLFNNCICVLSGEIPNSCIQNELADLVLYAVKKLSECLPLGDKRRINAFCKENKFSKEIYIIFERIFWIEDNRLFMLNSNDVSKMMYLLGIINIRFKDEFIILKTYELEFCKKHYKSVIDNIMPTLEDQVKINNLLIIVFIRIFGAYAKHELVAELRYKHILTNEDLDRFIKEIDELIDNNKLNFKYMKYINSDNK